MNEKLSRRSFLSGSAAALATVSMAPIVTSCQTTPSFPGIDEFGTKFGGVQIGAITYSWRNMPAGLENMVKYCKETGINSIELMSNDLETFLGAPENPMNRLRATPTGVGQQQGEGSRQSAGQRQGDGQQQGAGSRQGAGQRQGDGQQQGAGQRQGAGQQQGGGPAGAGAPQGRREMNPEAQAAITQYNEDLKAFRVGMTPEKIAPARKLFDDAGIEVHIVKFSPARWSDEELDYAFIAAKAMGAKAVCEEIGEAAVKKMAPFAEKHGMYAVFHNHAQFGTEGFSADPFLAVSPAVMLNFDAGHYYGSTGLNPCDFIRKYHERILSIHIKDKTGPQTQPMPDENQVWGQGETPLAELFLLIKKEGWPIYLDIELEYSIKPWSNQVKEVKTCVQYARNILV